MKLVFSFVSENPFRHPVKHSMWHSKIFFSRTKQGLLGLCHCRGLDVWHDRVLHHFGNLGALKWTKIINEYAWTSHISECMDILGRWSSKILEFFLEKKIRKNLKLQPPSLPQNNHGHPNYPLNSNTKYIAPSPIQIGQNKHHNLF